MTIYTTLAGISGPHLLDVGAKGGNGKLYTNDAIFAVTVINDNFSMLYSWD